MTFRKRCYAFVALVLCACTRMMVAQTDDLANPNKSIFVDDTKIESMTNVARTMHTPLRHSEGPIIVPDRPWEGSIVMQPGTVIYDQDEHIFKMWYNSLPTTSKPDIEELLLYATSVDGVHWSKPTLNIIDYRGSKENNAFLKWCSWTLSVVKDSREADRSKRYKLAYWNWRTRGKEGVWVAFSSDGIHWKDYERNPVVPLASSGDTFSVMQDPVSHEFWMYHKSAIASQAATVFGGASVRKVARMVSKDFVHWTNDELVLEPDSQDQPDTEFYGLSPFAYGDQYLGLLWVFHTYTQQIDIQLVASRDGRNWSRSVYRRVFFPLGFMRNAYDGRAFDTEMIMSIAPPAVKDGMLWMYYSGFTVKHNFGLDEVVLDDRYLGQIGLAKLPVDGFVSLDATSEGQVVSRPIAMHGTELHVAASTRSFGDPQQISPDWDQLYANVPDGRGEIRVELEDKDGKAIAGYTAEGCDPIKGSIGDWKVSWRGSSSIRSLDGKSVRIKFIVRNASLFSYSLE